MSVAPISGQMTASFTTGSSAVGGASAAATSAAPAAGDTAATGETAAAGGALGLQQSLLMQTGGGSNVDNLAALALSLLLGKSDDSKKSDNDPWKTLMALAMMSGAGGGQTTVSMTQSISAPSEAYSAAATAAPTSSVSLQG